MVSKLCFQTQLVPLTPRERAAAAGKPWDGPTDILAEESDRGAPIPKVIGSPPIILGGGDGVMVLPYWREHPRAAAAVGLCRLNQVDP
jgi:hypothetical protein